MPSSQESPELPGGRRVAKRANIWRESPKNEDGRVGRVEESRVARRDQSVREGSELLGGLRMAESRPRSEDGPKQPEGCQMIGRARRPQKDPSSQQVT